MSNDLAINEPLSSTPQFAVDDSTKTVSSLAISTDKIGIGTKTPQSALEVNGDVSVGASNSTTPTGYGARLRFNGVANNTDDQWISKFNVASDVTSLRINVGDNNEAASADSLDVGYTFHVDQKWYSLLQVTSVGTGVVKVAGALEVAGTTKFNGGIEFTGGFTAKNLPKAPSPANLTPLMIDRTTGIIYQLN